MNHASTAINAVKNIPIPSRLAVFVGKPQVKAARIRNKIAIPTIHLQKPITSITTPFYLRTFFKI
jgi:hypothetical protein